MSRYMGPNKEKDIIYQIFNMEVNQGVCMKSLIMHIPHWDILLRGYSDIGNVDGKYSTISNIPYYKHVQIMVASMTIHNFIRNHAIKDFEFQLDEDDEDLLPLDYLKINESQEKLSIKQSRAISNYEMDVLRDCIAIFLFIKLYIEHEFFFVSFIF